MSELARRADVSRAALYRRFASRDEVISALATFGGEPERFTDPVGIRDRVLDGFEAVAQQKGLAATTLEDVARHADVGVATLYRHFGGRAGLLEAYAEERTPRATLSELALDDGGDLTAALRRLATVTLEHLVRHAPLVLLSLSPDPETAQVVRHLRELEAAGRAQLRDYLEQHVASGRLRGDATTLANAFVGLLAGVVLGAPKAIVDAAPLADELVALFLRGCDSEALSSDPKVEER